jgi:hypothetical protein
MNLKSKSALIYDYGTFLPLAQRLSKDFGKVMYFTPWESKSPQFKLTLPGKDVPGVTRVNKFFDYVDEADVIIFPDCTNSDLQLHLEACGYNVFGSRNGCELEQDRVLSKEIFKKAKLPVGSYEVVKGMDKLRKYLKAHEEVFIKVDCMRGDFESFKSCNYDYISTKLDDIEHILGRSKNEVEFIVEEELPDKVEVGYDGYCIDGKFPKKTLFGIEIKDLGYIGVFIDHAKLPEPIHLVNDSLVPYLTKYQYRNFFSTEVRVGKDNKGYPIDLTCRLPIPPGNVYCDMFKNISEIIYEGAQGKLIEPESKSKFGVEVIINDEFAEENWVPVEFSKKYADNIKLRNVTYIDDCYVTIPQYVKTSDMGSIVCTGNSIDECVEKIEEMADDTKAFGIDIAKGSLDKANEEIEKLKKMGYDLFK